MKTEQLLITIPVTISYEKGCRKDAMSSIKRFFKDDVVPFEMEDVNSKAEHSYIVKGNKFKISKSKQ